MAGSPYRDPIPGNQNFNKSYTQHSSHPGICFKFFFKYEKPSYFVFEENKLFKKRLGKNDLKTPLD